MCRVCPFVLWHPSYSFDQVWESSYVLFSTVWCFLLWWLLLLFKVFHKHELLIVYIFQETTSSKDLQFFQATDLFPEKQPKSTYPPYIEPNRTTCMYSENTYGLNVYLCHTTLLLMNQWHQKTLVDLFGTVVQLLLLTKFFEESFFYICILSPSLKFFDGDFCETFQRDRWLALIC